MSEMDKNNAQTAEELFLAGTAACEAQDYEAALKAYEQAAKLGHLGAQLKCGEMYCKGQGTGANLLKAIDWYEKAAAQGDVGAQYLCAGLCLEFDWDPSHDWVGDALSWYEKAAEQGHVEAQLKCGEMYRCGRVGVERAALMWYKKAAEQGHAEAQYQCGRIYYGSEDMPMDPQKARMWFEKAAEQGHAEAQRALDEISFTPASVDGDLPF